MKMQPSTFTGSSMAEEPPRSRQARLAAEQALVRVVHHYGKTPEFVVLGGLVPELLCSSSPRQHAGTTDIDVQVNLEIECGAVNTARLEGALRNSDFEPDSERVWRWCMRTGVAGFLLAKCAAARSRNKPKDWYDIAYVLLHNDLGGPAEAASAVLEKFSGDALNASRTALAELAANFADPMAQGALAYAEQFVLDHPNEDHAQAKSDAVAAVAEFRERLSNA